MAHPDENTQLTIDHPMIPRVALTLLLVATGVVGRASVPALPVADQVARDAAPQQTGTGILRGRVVAEDFAKTPLVKARVTIGGTTTDPVFTDESGRFEFRNLPAGRYTLTAEKTGYARTRYGAKRELDPALPLEVPAAAVLEDLEIRMVKGSAIAGHIVDDLGDPVVGASVTVGALQRVGTESRFVGVSRPPSRTNDLGEFRIGGLPAGRYYVNVSGETEGSQVGGGASEWVRATSWARTFYQAAQGIATAIPIVLGVGEERSDVDFTLLPLKPAKLSVTLTDANGVAIAGLVNLIQEAELGGPIVGNRAVPLSGPPQRPMIPTLQPGEWIVVGPIEGAPASVTRIVLRSGEEAAVNVTPSRPARISGRVVFEGSIPPLVLTGLRVAVRSAGADINVPASFLAPKGTASVTQDGTFEIPEALGTVSLHVVNPPRGWTLKSVRYADRDLLDDPLTLMEGNDIRGVEVVLADQLAMLSGTVTAADGRPSASCAIALFPDGDDVRFGSRRMRLERTDQNGRFRLTDLLGGTYRVAAMSDIDASVWQTMDYLNQLLAGAARITLDGRSAQTVTLRCVSLP